MKFAILPLGKVEKKEMEEITSLLELKLKGKVKIKEEIIPIAKAFSQKRNQFDGEILLKQAFGYKKEGELLLAITNEDLFVPGLNYIFGISEIGKGTAILSLRRLREAGDGHVSRELYTERVLKEVLHEMGHAVGFTHCKDDCVMRFSNSIYEVDQKNEDFCDKHKTLFSQYLNP